MNNVSAVLDCLTFCSREINPQITRMIYNRRARALTYTFPFKICPARYRYFLNQFRDIYQYWYALKRITRVKARHYACEKIRARISSRSSWSSERARALLLHQTQTQLFSRDRDRQYCVKAFHKIRDPRRCNCYRAQVNSDSAQNIVGTRVTAIPYKCVGTYETGESRDEARSESEGNGGPGRGHETPKRFIKYHTAEHCYDTSMQILFCVCTREQSMTSSSSPPLILPSHPSDIFLPS